MDASARNRLLVKTPGQALVFRRREAKKERELKDLKRQQGAWYVLISSYIEHVYAVAIISRDPFECALEREPMPVFFYRILQYTTSTIAQHYYQTL